MEVSTFRGTQAGDDFADEHGRLLSDNVFGSQAEDAIRRDFTINALYFDPAAESVWDYVDGFADIKLRRLRLIGDPATRYREDPVRMLRAARLAAKLALAIEPKLPRAHLAMAYVYMLRKDLAKAGQEFKNAADLAPLRSPERIKYAEFQAANGASGEAKAYLQNLAQKAPDYIPAWRSLAQIALTEKKYDESLSLLENSNCRGTRCLPGSSKAGGGKALASETAKLPADASTMTRSPILRQ